ncbi:MAG: hypothetical protein ACP6IY_19530 [Promethearchaeia archaeon]
MSSTNRANAKKRKIADYYVTPQNCIRNFLNEWLSDLRGEFWDDRLYVGKRPDRALWLDPCAGGDLKHKMSYPEVLKKMFDVNTATIDIREDSLAEIKENFLKINFDKKEKFDVVMTNPPFNLAQEIIEKSFECVKESGYVVMLLRLNFLGSKARKLFWDKQLATWAYVHHRRMSFTDDGKTDSIEYAHFVWVKGQSPSFTMLKVI